MIKINYKDGDTLSSDNLNDIQDSIIENTKTLEQNQTTLNNINADLPSRKNTTVAGDMLYINDAIGKFESLIINGSYTQQNIPSLSNPSDILFFNNETLTVSNGGDYFISKSFIHEKNNYDKYFRIINDELYLFLDGRITRNQATKFNITSGISVYTNIKPITFKKNITYTLINLTKSEIYDAYMYYPRLLLYNSSNLSKSLKTIDTAYDDTTTTFSFTEDTTIDVIRLYWNLNTAAMEYFIYKGSLPLYIVEGDDYKLKSNCPSYIYDIDKIDISLPYQLRKLPTSDSNINDYIEVTDGKVLLYNMIGEYVYSSTDIVDGFENIGTNNVVNISSVISNYDTNFSNILLCNYGKYSSQSEDTEGIYILDGNVYIKGSFDSLDSAKTILDNTIAANKPFTIYYKLQSPIVTDITNSEFGQTILNTNLYYGRNVIYNTALSNISCTFLQKT